MNIKRLLLVAVVIAAAVAGCEKLWSDGYTWYMRGPAAKGWSWHTRDRIIVNNMCRPQPGDDFAACAEYDFAGGHCFVWSPYTLAEAKVKKTNGVTLFEHEVGVLLPDGTFDPEKRVGHCAGFDHREKHIRRV